MNPTTIAQTRRQPSNAAHGQLVATDRLLRAPDPQDGRSTSTVLELTAEGARFVAELMTSRRRLIDNVISRMGPPINAHCRWGSTRS